jgi:DNA (cytosine-5)-methyltransferase 1
VSASKQIKVVDIFAGPGGLGEGFSSFQSEEGGTSFRPFSIALSAEKDSAARSTLRLRAFFRQFEGIAAVPESYYQFVRGEIDADDLVRKHPEEWAKADAEALLLELGPESDRLHKLIRKSIGAEDQWILVGGPPCQAYSLVGRARNKGKQDYEPEQDHRHFLYREYLEILAKYRPDVFIMENVKGILTSKVAGEHIFQKILEDLHQPGAATGRRAGPTYDIYPLGPDAGGPYPLDDSNTNDRFVVRAEEHGIPQSRHRVILLGVRRGATRRTPRSLTNAPQTSLGEVLKDLPHLRSGLSKGPDSADEWEKAVKEQKTLVVNSLGSRRDTEALRDFLANYSPAHGLSRSSTRPSDHRFRIAHSEWLLDERIAATLNHETRGHMREDLGRYLYCATFAHLNEGRSPSSKEFPEKLAPEHVNWGLGYFADRFRAQGRDRPSSTITSHLSKDGHHFIHWDPTQCRSFTVREAARAQTFPDNYAFLGNRTEQYVQVGNAVPPLLAREIASVVWDCLK